MIKFLILSSSAGILLFLTTFRFETEPYEEVPKIQITNPIDRILGEHYYDNGSVRPNNFDSILCIPAKYLSDSSGHYKVTKLRSGLFLLKRKQFYYDNRQYSLIIETRQKRIVNVHPFVDLAIQDARYKNGELYLLQGDYTEIASHWRPTYSIKISCLDSNFRELWNVSSIPDKGAFFLGYSMKIVNKQLLVELGIQNEGSSTMCVSNYIMSLSQHGEILSSYGNGGYQCGPEPYIPLKYFRKLFAVQKPQID